MPVLPAAHVGRLAPRNPSAGSFTLPRVRVGPYSIDPDPIAVGGQARIYRGFNSESAEPVAVKAVTPTRNVLIHQGKIRRLRREVATLVELQHPNAPRVLSSDPGGQWFATPLATGDLGIAIEGGRVPWQRLRAGMLAVADVVARAHEIGRVHRDLHPGNVLLYLDRWCVADWGFVYSPHAERQTQQMVAFGLPFYVAPEVMREPSVIRSSADVFAIGRIAEVAAKIGSNRDSDDAATAWWRVLIDGAGAYDLGQRWTMIDVLAHLRTPLPLSRPVGVTPAFEGVGERCPNCGSPDGFDATCRCLGCHAVAY